MLTALCLSLLTATPLASVKVLRVQVGHTPAELLKLDIPDATWTTLELKLKNGTVAKLAINGDLPKMSTDLTTESARLSPLSFVERTFVETDKKLGEGYVEGWVTISDTSLGDLSINLASMTGVLSPHDLEPPYGDRAPRSSLRVVSWKRLTSDGLYDTGELALNGVALISRRAESVTFVTVPLTGGEETTVASFKYPMTPSCSSLTPPLCMFVELGVPDPPSHHWLLQGSSLSPSPTGLKKTEAQHECFALSPDGESIAEGTFSEYEDEPARIFVSGRKDGRQRWSVNQPERGNVGCTWVGRSLVTTNDVENSSTTWSPEGKPLATPAEWVSPGGWRASLVKDGVRMAPPAGSKAPAFTVKASNIEATRVRWLTDNALLITRFEVVEVSSRAVRRLLSVGLNPVAPTDQPGVVLITRIEGVYAATVR